MIARRFRFRFRFGLASLVAALALAAGAATGVALGSPSGQSPIQKAADKATKAGSAKFSFTLSISGGGLVLPGGKGLVLGGHGAYDTRHATGQVTLSLGALATSLGALTGGAKVPSNIEIVVVKNVVYIHLAALASQLSPGKEWLKLDPATLPKSSTGGADLGQLDPQQALSALNASVHVKKVGTETVGGVQTTHYRATIDVSKVAAAVPKSQRSDVQKSMKQLGVSSIPVDVWIDGSGYARRIVLALANLKAQAGSPAVSMKVTLNFSDFGTKVRVSAPPAAKVADASALLSQLTAGLGGNGGKTK